MLHLLIIDKLFSSNMVVMERDISVMLMFLAVTQEILNRYKSGIRLTLQEKVSFFTCMARTIESWERIYVVTCSNATLPPGPTQCAEAIEDGRI
jgi:hypothetical protein